jgi:hypothetical protein
MHRRIHACDWIYRGAWREYGMLRRFVGTVEWLLRYRGSYRGGLQVRAVGFRKLQQLCDR